MTTEEGYYHEAAGSIDHAVRGQLFGKPCYKVNGKAFCCFFQNEMVFKLTEEFHSHALSLSGSQLFDPSGKGRPMKAWVQVSALHHEQWAAFAAAAADFVQ